MFECRGLCKISSKTSGVSSKCRKRILKYVKGTLDHGLYYLKQTNQNLVGFCDADWTESMDDRRSTSGGCFFLGNNLISWHNISKNVSPFLLLMQNILLWKAVVLISCG